VNGDRMADFILLIDGYQTGRVGFVL